MCLKGICARIGVDDPGQAGDYGKTWRDVKDEFRNTMIRLARLGGLVCVSHAKEKRIESRKQDYDVITSTAPAGCIDTLSKFADLTAYYEVIEDGSRRLNITPSVEYEAGNRMETRFKDAETGKPLPYIPMGNSAVEAYELFMLAFNNELKLSDFELPEKEEQSEPKKSAVGFKKK
jgi:hypothetical protein